VLAKGSNVQILLLQEKQMIKVKEKLDKCNKEKLLEFCDLLDLTIARATTRKVCWLGISDAFLLIPFYTDLPSLLIIFYLCRKILLLR